MHNDAQLFHANITQACKLVWAIAALVCSRLRAASCSPGSATRSGAKERSRNWLHEQPVCGCVGTRRRHMWTV